MHKKLRLLYFVAEDWYFWSHRRLLASAAAEKGFEVIVVTRVNKYGSKIEDLGFKLIPIKLDRHGKNILRELELLYKIIKIYSEIKPDIVHHIALKPVLYGTFAALMTKIQIVVNTFPGFGYVFESKNISDRVISSILKCVFKLLFKIKPTRIIVQNKDNAQFLIDERLCKEQDISVIRGSGIDVTEYSPGKPDNTVPIILFASRLLWQKGISDFVDAARLVNKNSQAARFVIVGEPDLNNPNSVPNSTLMVWDKEGVVEWWGYKENMAEIISQSKVVVLPTFYGEGIPKILIEASACAVPVITTDTAGCREIVVQGKNGFLVSTHDSNAIAEHIVQLLFDEQLCVNMGMAGRKMVESDFSIEKVNAETLLVYDSMISN